MEAQKDEESIGLNRRLPMADHLDLFQRFYTDWKAADYLTHEAKEKGASWNSLTMKGQTLKLSQHVLMEESAGKKTKNKT